MEKTINHICSEEKLIRSAGDNVNDDGLEIGEEQAWEGYYKETAYVKK